MPSGVHDDDGQDPEHTFGAEDHAVGPEATVPGERAARDVLHRVGAERDHEADEQHLLAVEQPVGEPEHLEADDRERHQRHREDQARLGGLAHHRPAADRAGAAVGDRAPDLLLEREEEPRRDDEHEDPETVERRVLRLGEALERQDLEAVGRDARDQEPEADGVGPFGDGQLASGFDESLCALRHALSRWVREGGPEQGARRRGPGDTRRVSISVGPRRSGYQRPDAGREDGIGRSTRASGRGVGHPEPQRANHQGRDESGER